MQTPPPLNDLCRPRGRRTVTCCWMVDGYNPLGNTGESGCTGVTEGFFFDSNGSPVGDCQH